MCVMGLVVALTALGKIEEMRALVREALDKGGEDIPPGIREWLHMHGMQNGWPDTRDAPSRSPWSVGEVTSWLRQMLL